MNCVKVIGDERCVPIPKMSTGSGTKNNRHGYSSVPIFTVKVTRILVPFRVVMVTGGMATTIA
ncbi:hypothetical protein HanHA89_Chr17g0716051 [Helianthus annuus]|nr:hypothetical protein HanHA89_Chr17g0716051 [Helianthus annuus]